MTDSRYFSFSVFWVILLSCCLILFRPAEADAAFTMDGTYYPDILADVEVPSSYQLFLDSALSDCEYFFVVLDGETYKICFIDSDVCENIGYLWTFIDSSLSLRFNYCFAVSLNSSGKYEVLGCTSNVTEDGEQISIGSKGGPFKLLGTNFPLYQYYLDATGGVELPQDNLSFPGSAKSDAGVLTVPLVDTFVDVPVGDYRYYLVLYDADKYSTPVKNFTRVFLSYEPLQGYVENGAVYLRSGKKVLAYGMDSSKASVSDYLASSSIYYGNTLCTDGYSGYVSNYDLSYNDKVYLPAKPYAEITPAPTPTPVPEYTYKYDASAAGADVKGYARNQYPNGNGVDTIYIDAKSDFQSVYNSGVSYPDSSGLLISDAEPKVYVDYTVEIAFPSRDYINRLIKSENLSEVLDGIGLVEGSEYYMLNRQVYADWLASLGDRSSAEYYTISGRYSYLNYHAFKYMAAIKYYPYDALLSRFSDTASLKAYYGLSDKQWDKIGKYAMLFATPVSCTVRLGYRDSAYGYIYGDTTTTVFSTDGTGKVLVQSVVSGDTVSDADVRRENDYILKKYAMETGSVIGSVSDVSGAFENLGGSDIWATFKSATTGLMTMASSVSHIAIAIGAVFSFLPAGVYNLMYLTLMIVLVCAIIKAIRG